MCYDVSARVIIRPDQDLQANLDYLPYLLRTIYAYVSYVNMQVTAILKFIMTANMIAGTNSNTYFGQLSV